MEPLKLRDRDAILTEEGLIFRVYGYFHPPNAYVCDVEYAPSSIYKSMDPRAFRSKRNQTYYKFYTDEGLRFVKERYPGYTVFYELLKERLVGIEQRHIWKARRPDEKFQRLIYEEPKDDLLKTLHRVFDLITHRSGLRKRDFGVFGSLLHGFYHPKFSDIDLIIYGREKRQKLRETIEDLYSEEDSPLRNEFENERAIMGKHWRFINYSPKEYLWHQRRKMTYGLFRGNDIDRNIKVEFEPVKDWSEIHNEYSPDTRIIRKGWITATALVTEAKDAPFIPSIYQIEPMKILDGPKVENLWRIVSYVEEFRMQTESGEKVYVEGNLEQVTTPTEAFYQITLTYGARYYEQALKTLRM